MISVCNRQRARRVDWRWLKQIAERTLAAFPSRRLTLHLVLVGDAQIARLNRQFHATAGPTDILTFDYGAEAELIISVETAWRHARRYRSAFRRELALYVIHGILHLSGYDDRTPRQRARMRVAERRLLDAVTRVDRSGADR